MGKTNKDWDFRKLRKAGNNIRCLFDPKPARKKILNNPESSEEAVRLVTTYTEKELHNLVNRRHSAAHRDSARKLKKKYNRKLKRGERSIVKKEIEEDL